MYLLMLLQETFKIKIQLYAVWNGNLSQFQQVIMYDVHSLLCPFKYEYENVFYILHWIQHKICSFSEDLISGLKQLAVRRCYSHVV